jgi:hypothetical protein
VRGSLRGARGAGPCAPTIATLSATPSKTINDVTNSLVFISPSWNSTADGQPPTVTNFSLAVSRDPILFESARRFRRIGINLMTKISKQFSRPAHILDLSGAHMLHLSQPIWLMARLPPHTDDENLAR